MSSTYKIKALIQEIKSDSNNLQIKISGKSGKYAIDDTEDNNTKKKYNLLWLENGENSDIITVAKSADTFISTNGLSELQIQIIFACYTNNKLIELTLDENYIVKDVKGL